MAFDTFVPYQELPSVISEQLCKLSHEYIFYLHCEMLWPGQPQCKNKSKRIVLTILQDVLLLSMQHKRRCDRIRAL